MKKIFSVCGVIFLISCGNHGRYHIRAQEEFNAMFSQTIQGVQDIYTFFPKTVKEVESYIDWAIESAIKDLDALLAIAPKDRTFSNTAQYFDDIGKRFSIVANTCELLPMVHPDTAMREACKKAAIKLGAFNVDAFMSKPLYKAFDDYQKGAGKHEHLSDEQRYYIIEMMNDFKREGLNLSDAKLEEVRVLKKKLQELTLAFEKNIDEDKSSILATKEQLAGLEEHFIATLKQDGAGNYIVTCDYPTYNQVKEHCSVEDTRMRLHRAFNNCAYPDNVQLLQEIIALRDTLAHELGFESFAALDLDSVMAKKPSIAHHFIVELARKAKKKAAHEVADFKKELPAGVTLDAQGRFKPWDMEYIKADYKKRHFNLDERNVAQYFEADNTLKEVFAIYQQFLSLSFTVTKPEWSWHDDVKLIEVREQDGNKLRGYIFLDLYPRDNKYSHACHGSVVHATWKDKQAGQINPSLAIVIANFPKATADRPALLMHHDVETFFHEFGHAMHSILGVTELDAFSGTATKRDFVEMPSQIFEEWMFDKDLLKGISRHYKTGEPLPDALIDSLINLKKFASGLFLTRQCILSLMSLDFYAAGKHKDTSALVEQLYRTYAPEIAYDASTHSQARFGHLTGYGAKYYGYSWSKVFALDLFKMIKKQGLTNPAAGKLFTDKVLGKGGSVDPNTLLHDYLGRAPRQDAFFQDLGIE